MVLQGKNVLLISPEPWDHLFVSKHHYAVYLGKRGNKVFFLNPPSRSESVTSTDYQDVFSIQYTGFWMGLRLYPAFLRRYLLRRKYNSLQKKCGVAFDVVWSFDSSVFFDFAALPRYVLKISHIVDFNQDFQLKMVVSTADYCFCPSEILRRRLSPYNSKTIKISHGYAVPEHTVAEVNFLGKNRVKIFYAGNLDIPYIDWHLIQKLISQNSNVDFYFAGSKSETNKELTTLLKFDNFYYVGELKKNVLSAYLECTDVTILVYKADEFREQLANPHKVMEYLAAGKVIVSTYTDELRSLSEQQLVCMTSSNSEFLAMFSSVLKNLSEWNSSEKMQKRKQYALENTYDKQIEKIELIVK